MKDDQCETRDIQHGTNFESTKNSKHILRRFPTAVVKHILFVNDDENMSTELIASVRRNRKHGPRNSLSALLE